MKLFRYALAVTVLVFAVNALRRRRMRHGPPRHPRNREEEISRVEWEMEDQAMARAQSEVNSGEYDMQG